MDRPGLLAAFSRAIAQLPEPRFRRALWLSLGASVLVFAALAVGVRLLLDHTSLFSHPWANHLVDLGGEIAVLLVAWLMFPATVTLVMSLFLDGIVEAVEARYYPGLPAPRPQPLPQVLWSALRLSVLTVALNLLALPLYFIPVVNLAVFYALNGYLLSREYFELVALRRLAPREADSLRRAYLGKLVLGGMVLAFLFSLPLINLVAPLVGAAAMVHLVRGLGPEGAAAGIA